MFVGTRPPEAVRQLGMAIWFALLLAYLTGLPALLALCTLCRPSFEQIMQELERMKARLTNKAAAADGGLLHTVSDSAVLMHQNSLPSSMITAPHYR